MAINKVQFQKGLSIAEFMERYGTQEKCHAALVAIAMADRFCLPELRWLVEREDSRQFDGRVEIDDAYLGGEVSGKTGRGSENKVPFIFVALTCQSSCPDCFRHRLSLHPTPNGSSVWLNNVANQESLKDLKKPPAAYFITSPPSTNSV